MQGWNRGKERWRKRRMERTRYQQAGCWRSRWRWYCCWNCLDVICLGKSSVSTSARCKPSSDDRPALDSGFITQYSTVPYRSRIAARPNRMRLSRLLLLVERNGVAQLHKCEKRGRWCSGGGAATRRLLTGRAPLRERKCRMG